MFLRDDAEERRLSELYGQALPECAIKDRVSRLVDEVGKHDRVSIRELRRMAKEQVSCDDQTRRCQCNGKRPCPVCRGHTGDFDW